jgi:hypothetical protein
MWRRAVGADEPIYTVEEIEAARRLQSELSDYTILSALLNDSIALENEGELFDWLRYIVSPPLNVRRLTPDEAADDVRVVSELAKARDGDVLVKIEPPTHRLIETVKTQPTITDGEAARFSAGVMLVALEIVGGQPPDWLVAGLTAMTGEIARGIRADAVYPKGCKEFRDRLEAVATNAQILDRNPLVEEAARIGLRDVIGKVKAAIELIPKKRGRHKYYPEVDRSAETGKPNQKLEFLREDDLCALTICVLHKLVNGEWPGSKTGSVHRLCDHLWGAAGGDIVRSVYSRSDDSPPGNSKWVRHIRAATRYQDGPKALQIARILTRNAPPRGLDRPRLAVETPFDIECMQPTGG